MSIVGAYEMPYCGQWEKWKETRLDSEGQNHVLPFA